MLGSQIVSINFTSRYVLLDVPPIINTLPCSGRVIKQERIEAKHQQATPAIETEQGDLWGEGGHKNKQQLSLLSIKQETGGRVQLQPHTKPRCKLEVRITQNFTLLNAFVCVVQVG